MRFTTAASPHIVPNNSVGRIMWQLLCALLPGTLAMLWFFGAGVLINILLAVTAALLAESAALLLRRRPLQPYLSDYSAVVTAVLLALSLPALSPWWMTVTGVLFAILVAKHLYGGLGYNPFNPAMVGYVALLISFPKHMTAWLPPSAVADVSLGLAGAWDVIFHGQYPDGISADAVAMATPLDTLKTQLGLGKTVGEIWSDPRFGVLAGRGWQWAALGYLAGGLWMIRHQIIDWRIPAGFLGSLGLISLVFFLADPAHYAYPTLHLFGGASMLGAFFIATDPVTAATTQKGRLIYGALIGLLVYIIRTFGGYPDGVAFSVLLINVAAPMINYYTRPRTYGHSR
jgi:electron transport complex protein RnfD